MKTEMHRLCLWLLRDKTYMKNGRMMKMEKCRILVAGINTFFATVAIDIAGEHVTSISVHV